MNPNSHTQSRLVHLYRLVLARCHLVNSRLPAPGRGSVGRDRSNDAPEFAGLEPLNSRLHLAVTPGISGQTATLTGDSANDSIYVRLNPANELEFSSNGSIYSNDLDPVSAGVQAFVVGAGKSINVNSGAGNDSLLLDQTLRARLVGTGAALRYDGGTSGGGAGGDRFVAPDGGSAGAWTITGSNTGNLDTVISFVGVEQLSSGSQADTFTLNITTLGMRVSDAGGATTIRRLSGSLALEANVSVRGELLVAAPDTITVLPNISVSSRPVAPSANPVTAASTGDSGSQTYRADSISLEAGATLTARADSGFAGGDILIAASDRNLSPITKFDNSTELSQVFIRGSILGQEIIITADAADLNTPGSLGRVFNNQSDNNPNDGTDDRASFDLLELRNVGVSAVTSRLPVMVMRKRSESLIQLDATARITGDGHVIIASSALSDASIRVRTPLFSIGYGGAYSSAKAIIRNGARVSGGDVLISSYASSTAEIETATNTSLGSFPGDPARISVSLAIASADTTSQVLIEQGASVDARRSANIDALGSSTSSASADSGSYANGKAGIAVGLNFTTSSITADVAGTITSAAGEPPEQTYQLSVDLPTNTIDLLIAHGWRTGQPVTYARPMDAAATGGLADKHTYYVIRVPGSRTKLQLAESAADAYAGEAINLTANRPGVNTLTPELSNGVGVRAALTSADSASGSGAVAEPDPPIAQVLSGEVDEQSLMAVFAQPYLAGADPRSNSGTTSFALAGALAFSKVTNSVLATARASSVIKSRTGADIKATLEERLQSSAESAVSSEVGAEVGNAVSAAVIIGQYSNSAVAEAAGTLDAGGALTIASGVSYPFLTPPSEVLTADDFKFKDDDLGDFKTRLTAVMDGKLGITSKLFNTWAHATASVEGVGISGSVNYNKIDNTSAAAIRPEARINQDPAYRTSDQAVAVQADTLMQMVNMTGIFDIDLSPQTLLSLRAIGDAWALLNPVGNSAGKGGAGGSVFISKLTNSTTATVGRDALVNAGPAGALTVAAKEELQSYVLVQSGGKGGKFGVAGSFGLTDTTSNVTAQIDRGIRISAGSVAVTADSDLNQLVVMGGVQRGNGLGVGVTVGINQTTRNVLAVIGGLEGAPTSDYARVVAPGGITINARGKGNLGVFTMAAAVVSSPPPMNNGPDANGDVPPPGQDDDPLDGESLPNLFGDGAPSSAGSGNSTFGDKGKQGKSGIAISGDVAIEAITDNVKAYINDGGGEFITSSPNPSATSTGLVITARNSTNLTAASGAVAVATTSSTSAGIAGSVAVITLTGSTAAFITGGANISSPSGLYLTLNAARDGTIAAGTVAGAGATSRSGFGVSGSVSLLTIRDSTDAFISGGTIKDAYGVSVIAGDSSHILGIAGALSFGGRAGVGAGISVNTIQNTTRARVLGVRSIEQTGFIVQATNTGKVVSVVGSAGASRSVGAAGTLALNKVNNVTEASVQSTTETHRDGAAAPNYTKTVRASDTSDISAVSGAVGVGSNLGFGGALAYNKIGSSTRAFIGDSIIRAADTTSILADSAASISSIAAGGAGSQNISLAGAVAINQVNNTTEARLARGRLTAFTPTPRSLDVKAADSSSIRNFAGGLSVGGRASIGAAVGVNLISNQTDALLDGAAVEYPVLNVRVEARQTADIDSVSVAGAGAGTFAAGGGVSVNTIANTVQARIIGSSRVTAASVALTASDASTIDSLSGGVAGAGTAAIGAAVAVNDVGNTVRAQVDNSTVTTAEAGSIGDDILVTADESAKVNSITAAGAAAGTAAISGSISTTNLHTTTEALVTGGADVSAYDTVLISASDDVGASVLAGNVAGAGTAAIGVSVSTVVSNDATRARITGSRVSGTAGGPDIAQRGSANGATGYSGLKGASGSRQTQNYKGVALLATSFEKVINVAAGAVLGGTAGIAGSVTVTLLTENTVASADDNSSFNLLTGLQPYAGWDVTVLATDRTDLLGSAGAVAVGGAAGVGAGADGARITKLTEATIGGDARSQRNIVVQAVGSENVTSVGAAGSAGGTAGIAGAAGIQVYDITTRASIADPSPGTGGAAKAVAFGTVAVLADHSTSLDLITGSAGVGGVAGVGASVGVPVISDVTEAFIGRGATVQAQGAAYNAAPYSGVAVNDGTFTEQAVADSPDQNVPVRPGMSDTVKRPEIRPPDFSRNRDVTGSQRPTGQLLVTPNTTLVKGVAVSASNRNDLETISVSGSGAGVGAVSIAGTVLVLNTTTRAFVADSARVNQDAAFGASVLVAAGSDLYSLGITGSGAFAGVAAAAPAADLMIINNTTLAAIEASARVNADRGLTVRASARQDVLAVAAGVSAAGTVAAAGSLSLFKINDMTDAHVASLARVAVGTGSTISVLADDHTFLSEVEGAGALGVGIGGLAASVGVNLVTKSTLAYIGADAEATGGLTVRANSSEDLFTAAVAGAGGLVGGIAGSVTVNIVESNTSATILDRARVNAGSTAPSNDNVTVSAANDLRVRIIDGSIAGGLVGGIAGSIDLGIVLGTTSARIAPGASVRGNSLSVTATAGRDIDSKVASVGVAGGVGIAGSVSVYSLAAALDGTALSGLAGSGGSTGSFIDAEAVGKANTDMTRLLGGYSTTDRNGSDPAPDGPSLMGGAVRDAKSAESAAAATNATGSINTSLPRGGTSASIDDGAITTYNLSLTVRADERVRVTTSVGAAAAGFGAVGGAATIVTNASNVSASLSGSVTGPTTYGQVLISASLDEQIDGFGFAGSGGALALGAQYVRMVDSGNVSAAVSPGANFIAGSRLTVAASSLRDVESDAVGGGVGLVAAGLSLASASVTGSVKARVLPGARFNANLLGAVAITATSTALASAEADAVVAGALGAAGADARASSTPVVEASIGAGIRLDGPRTGSADLTVIATSFTRDTAAARGRAVASIGGIGVSQASALSQPTVTALIGAGAVINAVAVNIQASQNTGLSGDQLLGNAATATANAAGGGLIGGVGGAVATAVNSPAVRAELGAGVDINASWTFGVNAQSVNAANATATGDGAGIIGIGAAVSGATVNGSTTATAGANSTLDSARAFVGLSARSFDQASALSVAGSGGLVAVSENAAVSVVAPTVRVLTGDNVDITAETYVQLNTSSEVHASSQAMGVSAGVVAKVGTSRAAATAAPVVGTIVGQRADLISLTGQVFIESAVNYIAFPGILISNAAQAFSSASVVGLLFADAPSTVTLVVSNISATTDIGPNSRIVAGQNVAGGGNAAYVRIRADAGNDTTLRAAAAVAGLFTRSGTEVVSSTTTGATVNLGAGARVLAKDQLFAVSNAQTATHATVTGGGGSTIADFLRSIFNGDISGAFNNLPSIVSGGGVIATLNVAAASRTNIGAGSQIVASDLTVTASSGTDVNGYTSMESRGALRADATAVTILNIDSDAFVDVGANSTLSARTITLTAVNALGASAIANGTTNVSVGGASATGITRVNIGVGAASGGRSEALVNIGAGAAVTADQHIIMSAVTRQMDAALKLNSEARSRASGGLVSTAKALADGTINVGSRVETASGSTATAPNHATTARTTVELDRKPIAAADTIASRFVTRARNVVRTVTRWLPWPLDAIVEAVTSVVFDVVEVFDFSSVLGVQGGGGVTRTDVYRQNGAVTNQVPVNRRVVIDPVGPSVGPRGPGGGNGSNVGYHFSPQGIVLDDIVSEGAMSVEIDVPFGEVTGDGQIYIHNLINQVDVINNTDSNLIVEDLRMIRDDEPEVRINSDHGSVRVNRDLVHSHLLIQDNGAGDVILTHPIDNVSADIHIISHGSILAADPSVYIESGDVGKLRMEAGGGIGSPGMPLHVRVVRGKLMPDGTPSTMPARISALAGGGVYLDVIGENEYYGHVGDGEFEADGIFIDALAGGPIRIAISETELIDDHLAVHHGEGVYEFTKLRSATGDITLSVAAGDAVLGDISTPGTLTIDAERSILAGETEHGVLADSARLVACDHIGDADQPLTTTIHHLAARAGTGGVHINNAGALEIGPVSGLSGLAAGGEIALATTGPLTVRSAISATGPVDLRAVDSFGFGDDVLVDAGVQVSSAAGRLRLAAGDNLRVLAGASLSAATSILVEADADNADPGVGATLSIAGTLAAADAALTTGDDGDLIDLSTAVPGVTPISITSGAGADSVFGTAAADTIDPGTGDDVVFAGGGGDTINNAELTDTILAGRINAAASQDAFRFRFTAGQVLTFGVSVINGDPHPILTLLDPQGGILGQGPGPLTIETALSGVFTLLVNAAPGGGTGDYNLSVTPDTRVRSVAVNDGLLQRSNLTSIAIGFDGPTGFAALIAGGQIASLVRVFDKSTNTPLTFLDASHYTFDAAANILTIDLTADGPGGSAATAVPDGRYQVRFDVPAIRAAAGATLLDGDGVDDGLLTIDRSSGSDHQDFFRLAGDLDGDAAVGVGDTHQFITWFNTNDRRGDANGDGVVNLSDYILILNGWGRHLA